MPGPLIGLAVGAAARVAAKKIASNVAKKAATKKGASPETIKIQKASVKKITPAKPKPNRVSKAKGEYKFDDSRGRAYERGFREYEKDNPKFGNKYEQQDSARSFVMDTPRGKKISRKIIASRPKKTMMTKNDIKIADRRNSGKPVVKINSAKLEPNKIIKKTIVKDSATKKNTTRAVVNSIQKNSVKPSYTRFPKGSKEFKENPWARK